VSAGLAPSGKQRGWQNQNRSSGVAWTFNLDELCADLAQRIHGLVEDSLLNPDVVMPASVIRAPGDASQQRERRAQQLDGRLSAAQAKHDDLLTATVGLRTAAGIFAAKGDDAKFAEYDLLADAKAQEAHSARQEISEVTAKMAALHAEPEPVDDDQDEADASVAAYLVAGLRRAASANGRGPRRLRLTTAATLTQWAFRDVGPALLAYDVTLVAAAAQRGAHGASPGRPNPQCSHQHRPERGAPPTWSRQPSCETGAPWTRSPPRSPRPSGSSFSCVTSCPGCAITG